MKLISMVDFVLTGKYTLAGIKNYATFLKKPLTLGMFVTCDEYGNFFEEPKEQNYNLGDIHAGYFTKDIEKYNKSKEKVLFEGFEIHDIYVTHKFELKKQLSYISGFTVEDVVGYAVELTENALKQIGL